MRILLNLFLYRVSNKYITQVTSINELSHSNTVGVKCRRSIGALLSVPAWQKEFTKQWIFSFLTCRPVPYKKLATPYSSNLFGREGWGPVWPIHIEGFLKNEGPSWRLFRAYSVTVRVCVIMAQAWFLCKFGGISLFGHQLFMHAPTNATGVTNNPCCLCKFCQFWSFDISFIFSVII